MEPIGIGGMAALAAGTALVLGISVLRSRRRMRKRAAAAEAAGAPPTAAGRPAKGGARLAALEAAQADLTARLDALAARQGAPEERLQAMAQQLVGLIRDKNATFETAIAGLDQLRARMRALEEMGEPAEARALVDGLAERLDALQREQAAGAAAVTARLAALEAPGEAPFAAIADQLTRLYAQKDAGVAALIERLAPIEERLAGLEGAAPARAELARLAERLDAMAAEQGTVRAALAGLEAEAGPAAEIAERLAALHAGREALAETVLARLDTVEAALGEPRAALDRFAERLEAVQGRLAALEAPGENPFAEIAEQLSRLYAQKDATVETVFARLAPLEEKLAAVEGRIGDMDPNAALDRFAERLEAVRTALEGRLAALEAPDENPFAEISEQLGRLYAQKDATVETVFARLAPLEEKLAAMEGRLSEPRAALDRFAERLEVVQGRLAALEAPGESPFAEISEQLSRLYAQKDATVETVFARLAPLEEKLAAMEGRLDEPRATLDRFAERLEAVQGRLAALEAPGENPFAEISDQLTRLYAQKDATVETVFARLAPLEEKLAELEGGLARLAPLAEADPRAELDGLGNRLEALHWAQGELAAGFAAMKAAGEDAAARTAPLAEIADQLTRLYAQKDGALATVLARIAPLEDRLAALEDRPWDPDAEEARAQAQAIAAQMIALRTAAEQTETFADRLTLLEASLPKLSAAQTLLMQVLERQAAPAPAEPAPGSVLPMPQPAAKPTAAAAGAHAAASEMEEVWTLPRLVSLHRK